MFDPNRTRVQPLAASRLHPSFWLALVLAALLLVVLMLWAITPGTEWPHLSALVERFSAGTPHLTPPAEVPRG